MTRQSQPCADRKVPLRNEREALIAARRFSMQLNAERKLAPTFYLYRCASCHALHLTHHEKWDGRPNKLVLTAAPENLQRWAFPS